MKKALTLARTFAPLLLTAVLICLPLVVVAQNTGSGGGSPNFGSGGGTPNFGSGGSRSIENPLRVSNFCDLLELILRAVVIIGMPIAVLFLLYVGFQFILARGSSDGLSKAKTNLFYTIVGIGIFLGAWTIAQIIKNTLQALGVGSFGSC